MRIYHFELPKLGHGLSGGEQCLVEVVRRLRDKGIANTIVTTDNGRDTYESVGLAKGPCLEYATVDSCSHESRHHVFVSYIHRTRLACRLVDGLHPQNGDVLLCNSDAFPNSIPFYRLARRRPGTRLLYWYRMEAPALFHGYEGHFTGRYRLPSLALVQYRLSQWLFRQLVLPRGTIVTHNPYYRALLNRTFPRNRIHQLQRYGGGLTLDKQPDASERRYDLAWIGRFHTQKGLWELIDIVRRLKAVKPDVSLAVMGADARGQTSAFERACAAAGLSDNIHCVGEVHGERKFDYLLHSRVYLMTSYYESYGIVVVEAMSAALPVVAYDLPVFGVFTRGIVKVPLLDNTAIANAVLQLLHDDTKRAILAREAWNASREHTWDRVAEELLALCKDDDSDNGPS